MLRGFFFRVEFGIQVSINVEPNTYATQPMLPVNYSGKLGKLTSYEEYAIARTYLQTFIRLVIQILKQYSTTQPGVVPKCWSRAQHHVTTSLMQLAVGEQNVAINLGTTPGCVVEYCFSNCPNILTCFIKLIINN